MYDHPQSLLHMANTSTTNTAGALHSGQQAKPIVTELANPAHPSDSNHPPGFGHAAVETLTDAGADEALAVAE